VRIERKQNLKEMKEKSFPNFYFFSGKNEFEIERIIQDIKETVISPSFESFDFEKFDANDKTFDVDNFKRAYLTPPMASPKRLLLLNKIEKLTNNGKDTLLSILNNPIESSMLIMVAGPTAKLKSTFFDKIKAVSKSETFNQLRTNMLGKWIKNYFKTNGFTISLDAIFSIIEYVGNVQISLREEIEKIITYMDEKKVIAKEDVLPVLSSNQVKTVFDLNDAVGLRNLKKALLILNYLLEWGVARENIFANLRSFILRLHIMFYYRRKGLKFSEILKRIGKPEFVVKKEMRCLERFSESELKKRLALVYDAEAQMKSGSDSDLVLIDLIYNLI